MPEPRSDISAFYDAFLRESMVSYRIDGNARINAAIELVPPYVKPAAQIADIGCGVGILAEAMARAEPSSHVVGIDVSTANIEYAKRTIRAPNTTFVASSVTEQFGELRQKAINGFDLICLIDVIEHIPDSDRLSLFINLAEIATDEAVLAISYPSPEHQRHLEQNETDKPQIIDNATQVELLIQEASTAGWNIIYFEYKSIWRKNQYCRSIFTRQRDLSERIHKNVSIFSRIRKQIDSKLLRSGRVRKYAIDPFRNWPSN